MVVKKLSKKTAKEFIQEGGKPSGLQTDIEEIRFTLRIPVKLMDLVDVSRNQKIGKVSKNNWILEAIESRLQQENKN